MNEIMVFITFQIYERSFLPSVVHIFVQLVALGQKNTPSFWKQYLRRRTTLKQQLAQKYTEIEKKNPP